MPKCECMKMANIGQSAAKPRIVEGSTTKIEITSISAPHLSEMKI